MAIVYVDNSLQYARSSILFTRARVNAQGRYKQLVHASECGYVIEVLVASYRLATACGEIRSAMLRLITDRSPLVGPSRYEISALREVALGGMYECLANGISANATMSSIDALWNNTHVVDHLLTNAIIDSLQ